MKTGSFPFGPRSLRLFFFLAISVPGMSAMERAYAAGQAVPTMTKEEDAATFKAKVLAGDSYALYQLAFLYRDGEKGAPKRPDLYHKFLVAAAVRGETDAMVQLGYDYRVGEGGVDQDYALARKWYLAAYKRGDPNAEFGIGYLFDNGLGVPTDYDVAEKYYAAAAAKGVAGAWTNIGVIYEQQRNDGCKALAYYKLAASSGDALGAANLGHSYMTGICGNPNAVTARLWFKRALAVKGDDDDTIKGREWAQSGVDDLNRPPPQAVASGDGPAWFGGGCDEKCQQLNNAQISMQIQRQNTYVDPPPPPPPPTPVLPDFARAGYGQIP